MAVAQFEPGPGGPPPGGHVISRQTALRTLPIGDPPLACGWRTGYPVRLWPVQVARAQVEPRPPADAPPGTRSVLRLHLECTGGHAFADLALDRLRFFLNGESQLIASLYQAIFQHTLQVVFRPPDRPGAALALDPRACLTQVGFEPDEGLIPFPCESFVGDRLLMELLSFPTKFLFLDLGGWQQARAAGFGRQAEVVFYLNRRSENLEQGVAAQTFLLGCTPIVNVFPKSAEPIAWTQTRSEYTVIPSRACPPGMEVFSVDAVSAMDGRRGAFTEFHPFFDYGLGESRATRRAVWHAVRRPSEREGDAGTEVSLVLVDRDGDLRQPADSVLHVETTCTNRDYPHRFLRGRDVLTYDPGEASAVPVRCLRAPSPPLRPPLGRDAYWRLLARLALDRQSLADPAAGLAALKETLRLCDFTEGASQPAAAANRQLIDGLVALRTRRVLAPVTSADGIGFCRGMEYRLELDEKKYVGVGAFLFASVLERYLGLAAAVNSFSQLVVRTTQGEFSRTWPPRSAHQPIR